MYLGKGLIKYPIDFKIGDIYYFYKKSCKGRPIGKVRYCKIVKNFNKQLSHEIIHNAFSFKMPGLLGYLRGMKFKVKSNKSIHQRFPIDFKKTVDFWFEKYEGKVWKEIKEIKNKTYIRHTNKQTAGWRCKWSWDKRCLKVKNSYNYVFKAVRTNSREMSKVFRDRKSKINYYLSSDVKW